MRQLLRVPSQEASFLFCNWWHWNCNILELFLTKRTAAGITGGVFVNHTSDWKSDVNGRGSISNPRRSSFSLSAEIEYLPKDFKKTTGVLSSLYPKNFGLIVRKLLILFYLSLDMMGFLEEWNEFTISDHLLDVTWALELPVKELKAVLRICPVCSWTSLDLSSWRHE